MMRNAIIHRTAPRRIVTNRLVSALAVLDGLGFAAPALVQDAPPPDPANRQIFFIR